MFENKSSALAYTNEISRVIGHFIQIGLHVAKKKLL